MRALFRVLFALVILGALSGCTNNTSIVRYDGCENHPEDPCDFATEKFESEREQMDMQSEDDHREAQEEYEEHQWAEDQSNEYGGDDIACEDFNSRAEAQSYLEANPADADYLDGDGDGIACEWGT